jgi:hypothetical protein
MLMLSYSESWPVRMGPIRCPETSVNNYHTTPCNNLEDHRFKKITFVYACVKHSLSRKCFRTDIRGAQFPGALSCSFSPYRHICITLHTPRRKRKTTVRFNRSLQNCASSVWNLFRVAFLAPKMLRLRTIFANFVYPWLIRLTQIHILFYVPVFCMTKCLLKQVRLQLLGCSGHTGPTGTKIKLRTQISVQKPGSQFSQSPLCIWN